MPDDLRSYLRHPPFYVSEGSVPVATGIDLGDVRDAIHAARKLSIAYVDEQGRHTGRTVQPIALAYYVDVTVIAAWCELRNDFRHFRVDRIRSACVLDTHFGGEAGSLLERWLTLSSGGSPAANSN